MSLKLCSLEARLTDNPTKRTLRQILKIRSKLKTFASGRAEKLLLHSRQTFYEWANKAYTLLAKMLREEAAQRTPNSLRNDKVQNITHDLKWNM